jgi:hypothetical protein
MCLIYEDKSKQQYIYIHIPKNSGKYIRNKIKSNNKIIKSYWGIQNNLDVAHIPFMFINNYIKKSTYNYKCFSYSRNPYNRIISAFFYLNPGKSVNDFKYFCKTKLIKLNFHLKFDKYYIHYYPQYLFVCDKNFKINEVTILKLEEHEKPKVYDTCKYFDKETVKIINDIYRKDFELFNYKQII